MTPAVPSRLFGRGFVALVLVTHLSSDAFAAMFFCPSVPGPYPQPAVVLSSTVDKKGGKLELTCTNDSATGDFVWTYAPPGGGAKITIGRCVFVGGQNDTRSITDPVTGNLKTWMHSCVDPTPINAAGDKRAVLDIFDKAANKSTQRQLTYKVAQSKWVETAARFDTSNATYLAFNPADNNGDGIPDESFNHITSNLYGTNVPDNLHGEYESNVSLASAFVSGANRITWDVGALTPTYVAGDYIDLDNVQPGDVLSSDPRVTLSTTSRGVRLSVNTTWTPTTSELLAELAPTLPNTSYSVDYAISDGDAGAYYAEIFDDPRPLDEIGFSSNLDFTDMPGYGAGMGDLVMVPEPSMMLMALAMPLIARRR
jgi:hypothetical protein